MWKAPRKWIVGAVAMLAVSAGAVASQESAATPASVDEKSRGIIDRYIEVTGGKAAYDKLTSRKVTLSLEVKGQNLTGQIVLTAKAPDKLHVVQEITGLGGSEQGFDGKVAWEKNPMTGNRLIAGDELVQLKERAYFNATTEPEKVYTTIKHVGEETVDGKVADKLEMTNASGTTTQLVDRESGLIVQQKSIIKSPQGEIPVTVTFADYKEVDGIKVAHTMIQDLGMAVIETKVTDLKHNIEIDEAIFAAPAELKK